MNLKNFKQTMIKKAIKKGGVWENFGQKELRKLKDEYHHNPYASKYGNAKEYEIDQAIRELDNWVSHFDLSQLNNSKKGNYNE
ncbi:MAG: hypothetical protein RAP03_01900 [Candidatus Electryonea clarkiae]|nr:hypothetical protein [Candidatus Electryonea clarkiae]